MIFVDSDVFLIDLRYRRDRRFAANARFLDRIRDRGDGLTTLFNLLEVCGILSFNLSARQLRELYVYFPTRYRLSIWPSPARGALLPRLTASSVLKVMETKASLGDAQIIAVVRGLEPRPDLAVTWNTVHFAGRLEAPVVTPAEALQRL